MIKKSAVTLHPRSQAETEGETHGTETYVKDSEEITVSDLCFYKKNTSVAVGMIDQMGGDENMKEEVIKLTPFPILHL